MHDVLHRSNRCAAGWDKDAWNVTATASYRSDMKHVAIDGDICASQFANGSPAPNSCKLASFTAVDLSAG